MYVRRVYKIYNVALNIQGVEDAHDAVQMDKQLLVTEKLNPGTGNL